MIKLEALGLVETTSATQLKNGTRRFYDPITTCNYLSYESGYIRREYMTTSWRTGRPLRTIYQLNKTMKGTWTSSTGAEYAVTERVMVTDAAERLDRLARAAANYRVTCQGYFEAKKARDRQITTLVVEDSINQFFEGNVNLETAIEEIKSTLVGATERGLV